VKDRLLRVLERGGVLRRAYRLYELAKSARPERPGGRVAADGLPVPPRRLIVRVAGTASAEWFLEGGRLGAETIRAALARQGRPLERLDAMLDFGCGCGRVTRYWADLERTRVHGTDANADAVEWCRRNLTFARFEANGLAPPLPYDTASFDLVYALSVFTHLTADLQLAWRDELRRVLRPGGRLGLLVFVADGPLTPPLPEGNEFPTEEELLGLLGDAGFALQETSEADLGDSPPEWSERADAVDAEVERRHGSDPAFRQAQENAKRVGRLLSAGELRPWMGVLTVA
jgi:SAM-dependent methyltransferase